MNFRSLRAANQGLYLGTTLLVLGACGYTLWRGERPEWQLWLAAAAALAALVWGGYYVMLRYQVDALGVTRHSLLGRTCILWEELEKATLEEQHSPGTTHCAIHLRSNNGTTLTLSSDLLALDAIEEFATDLRAHGLLPPAPEGAEEE